MKHALSRLAHTIGLLIFGFIFVSIGAASATSAGPLTGVYAGTIGSSAVVAEFGTNSMEAFETGVYFYRSYAIGIALSTSVNRDAIVVHDFSGTNFWGPRRTGAIWNLHRSGSALYGSWRAENGRTAAIALRKVGDTSRDEGSGGGPELAPATYRELFRYPRTFGDDVGLSPGLTYRTLTDSRIGISTVELTSLLPLYKRRLANTVLRKDFDERRKRAIDCDARMNELGYYEKTHVTFLSRNALSLAESDEYSCGGAHPGEDSTPITIDLRTGTAVSWNRAIADKALAAKLYARGAPAALKSTGYAKSCADVYMPTNRYAYEIVPSGLSIRADLPHVVAVCEADVVITSAVARSIVAPAYRDLLP